MHLLERSLADYGLHCAMPYVDEEIRDCWEHTANKNWVQAHVLLTPQESCSPPLFPGQGLCLNYLCIYLSGSSIMFRKCLWNWTSLDDCVTQNLECDVCWGKQQYQVSGTGRSTVLLAPSLLHSQEPENQMKSPGRGCQAHWKKKWQRQSVFCT